MEREAQVTSEKKNPNWIKRAFIVLVAAIGIVAGIDFLNRAR